MVGPYNPDLRRSQSKQSELNPQLTLAMQSVLEKSAELNSVGSKTKQIKLNASTSMGEETKFKRNKVVRRQSTSYIPNTPVRALGNPIYRFFYAMCTHYAFTLVITILIITNTIVLATD